ncbi:helix-turn-helix domain-containing protein [Shewanella frigidimarina]|jgi:putative transcriptional regulator|uniref:helix-turn-helix domain-containing protein n=1 Tax=Shewanella frigidimarina TaxID=56812 RepID=UPI000F4FF9F0|nr:DNA-binding transcriptional regulator [Shewanella frigidimarina]RPA23356.1 DNA-binding transcriptional regulator [Shewanella frigidimarina]
MSRLLQSLHNTAKGLHDAGLMKPATMREFDELCLPELKVLSAADIKRIRVSNKVSQPVFARCLNVSVSSVQKWEQGKRHPEGPALKLLNLVQAKGFDLLKA